MREIEVDYMNINEVFSGLDKLFAENRLPEVERYLTQALSDAEYEKDTDSMLAIYNELIGFHRTTGEHDKALYFCRQVMRLAHKMGIEDTVPYGTALMNIANENRAAGNLLEALSYCRKVYDIYSEQLGPYDILLAGYYNNVALIYQELGDYDKAVDALEHALSIIERHENAGTEIVADGGGAQISAQGCQRISLQCCAVCCCRGVVQTGGLPAGTQILSACGRRTLQCLWGQ